MQINSTNNLNFQKKLVATAHVGTKYNPQPVEIYHMNEKSDADELKKKLTTSEWQDAHYTKEIVHFFKRDYNYSNYYVIEAGDEIINFADTYNNENGLLINFLETAPKYAKDSGRERLYKYAGETMLSFLAKLAKEENKDEIYLEYRNVKSTRDFYFSQCGFMPEDGNIAVLGRCVFDDLIEQNENHTGSSINLVI